MMLAQRLYEGVELGEEGAVALITYMRTDSVRVSNDALGPGPRAHRLSYGEKYLPEKPNFFKSKKDAQEAHEAIRPTDVARTPESVRRYLPDDMFRLYQMIWQRFVASQMVPAVFDQTTVDISANDYTFRASGSVVKFDGYLTVYQVVKEEEEKEDQGDTDSRTLPQLARRRALAPGNDPPGAALHRAAAALHRSDAREGARRKGHRPAFHLRHDHLDDRRARVRQQGSGPLYSRLCWAKK